jgi:hypothetical protein
MLYSENRVSFDIFPIDVHTSTLYLYIRHYICTIYYYNMLRTHFTTIPKNNQHAHVNHYNAQFF